MYLQCRIILCLLTLAAASAGCYWSLRLARADWYASQATVPAANKSIELAPSSSAYLQHAFEIREAEGLPAAGLRERAARMNPLDSANWIHLAVRAESEGQRSDAEQKLLRAFNVDRQFEPRWALANFYYRAGNPEMALGWVRKTLEFGAGNLTAVFQLCWMISDNAGDILKKAIPYRPEVLAQYVRFLDEKGRSGEAGDVANALLPLASSEEVGALIRHCTRSLEAGQPAAALTVWNGLVGRGLIAGEKLEPETGHVSADAGFQGSMTGQAFEWMAQRADGVRVEAVKDRRAVRIVFSRNEPEHFAILGQWIVLSPGVKYHYRVAYAASGMDAAGLKWIVYSQPGEASLTSSELPGGQVTTGTIEGRFHAPAGVQFARLELRYDRAPGMVRPEGSIEFSGFTLQSQQ